jgi:two-component system cell cycle sensor histidine kinase/response regulator CckA
MKILVVEDDEMTRDMLCEHLEAEGFETLRASDGQMALSLVKADSTLELVFTDIKMPKIDGIELARILSGLRPGLPVVLVSGYLDRTEYSNITPKPYALIAKPFKLAEILGIARKIAKKPA